MGRERGERDGGKSGPVVVERRLDSVIGGLTKKRKVKRTRNKKCVVS